ncbi:hypothetical protein GCM10009839_38980 [Catenulispora yoronensis]|uniref:Uncharacterized protein n=1 Tax=Catenulispora yoronensis TaxID=450799 RepID=A0ABP5FXC8_9ACTN
MAAQGTNAVPKSRTRRIAEAPRVRGRLILVKTGVGTQQRFIFYACCACGSQHRVTEFGIRVTACRNGLVFVVAGGA